MMQVGGWGGVPSTVKLKSKRRVRRGLTDAVRKAIAQDTRRPLRVIAEEYGVSEITVRRCHREFNGSAYRGWVKLSADEVKTIFRDPRSQRMIAADYGVTKTTIRNIKARRNHKHVTEHL